MVAGLGQRKGKVGRLPIEAAVRNRYLGHQTAICCISAINNIWGRIRRNS